MRKGRILILVLMALAMLITAIVTWGSIGSITLIFCLILMGLALLRQWFTELQEDNDFQTEL